MSKSNASAPTWDTSSFGHPADMSAKENSALGEHLTQCDSSLGPLHALRNGAGLVSGFVVPRLVTTVLATVVIAGAAWLAF